MSEQESINSEEMKKIDLLLYKILDPNARERINNVRLVNIERYLQVANFLMTNAQENKLELPINDATLKQILLQTVNSREINIVRK